MTRNKTAFQEWHTSEIYAYRPALIAIIEELNGLPRFPDVITETEISRIQEIATALNIYDRIKPFKLETTPGFFKAVGVLKEEIINRLEKQLKPTDPLAEVFKDLLSDSKLNGNDINDILTDKEEAPPLISSGNEKEGEDNDK